MYDRIMVPLDGSKLGEAAIPFVNEIISGARETRRIVIFLVQVVPGQKTIIPPVTPGNPWSGVVNMPYSSSETEQIVKPVMEYLERVGATLVRAPNVTIQPVVKIGEDPAEVILKASDELKIDLIAISTHGRSGITRWAYGSVADKILRGGNTPVFMVRAGIK
jgi:nucleotide-binding universal stress UspA family protein